MSTLDRMGDTIAKLWESATAIEPAAGRVNAADLKALRAGIEKLRTDPELAELDAEERESVDNGLATIMSRAAVSALASGDKLGAHELLLAAQRLSRDDDQRALLEVALRDPERYRKLVHGRYQFRFGHEGSARRLWKQAAAGGLDPIRTAAKAELNAPRPLTGGAPSLRTVNGIGTRFYGSRDRADDRSYVTTHCITALFIPIFPLAAYRVRDTGPSSYSVLAREQLSTFAKAARIALPALLVLAFIGSQVNSYLNDPRRVASHRLSAALDDALNSSDRDAAAHRLELALDRDVGMAPRDVSERAGAELVKRSIETVSTPFKRANVDQANRAVLRFNSLPDEAKGGPARTAITTAVDGWASKLDAPDDVDAKLTMLRLELTVADSSTKIGIEQRISEQRLALAKAKSADWPLDALAALVEPPTDTASAAAATEIVKRLVEVPALLDDAGPDLDAWLATQPSDDGFLKQVTDARDVARAARLQAETEGISVAALQALLKADPQNQHAVLALAIHDVDAGKLDAADARLRKIGPLGLVIRDAQFALARIAVSRGKLDVADEMLTRLVASRLQRFVAASSGLDTAFDRAKDRLKATLDSGAVPEQLRTAVDVAPEAERSEIIQKWFQDEIAKDPDIIKQRAALESYGDVVAMAVASGTVKLRRAQAMSGSARDAMLGEAERAFLAVKTQAGGNAQFQLALGEVYARLGKTAESEAAFKTVLDLKDPEQTLAVASLYRTLGNAARSKEIATELYPTAPEAVQRATAGLLSQLYTTTGDDDQVESWLRKAGTEQPFVKASLLEVEARRLAREGKLAECDHKLAEAAQIQARTANGKDTAGYNNAALDHESRFACSGDMSALRDAEQVMGQAYRVGGDDAIVVGNFASLLAQNAQTRAIAKLINLAALQASESDVASLSSVFEVTSQREQIVASLKADPGWRRSEELLAHYEVLAPNSTVPYDQQLSRARLLRDEAAAVAIVARLHQAKALDTSEVATARDRWISGAEDDLFKLSYTTTIARYTRALDHGKLDPQSHGAALYLRAEAERKLAVYWGGEDDMTKAIADRREAAKLWDAIGTAGIDGFIIDQLGLRFDATAWQKLRRTHSTIAGLAKLADANDPLATKIRSAPEWQQALALSRTSTFPPTVDDLRLARLSGDPALAKLAEPARTDKMTRALVEASKITDPADPEPAEDLAELDRH